jgi:flagellar biosynthesis protein FliP
MRLRSLWRTPRRRWGTLLLSLVVLGLLSCVPDALAQEAPRAAGGTGAANPVVLVIVLGALALAPFALIMLTSFVKISVVLSILRNALGTQQVPPNQVITGISLILTIFIMAPVVEKMYAEAGNVGDSEAIFSEVSVRQIFEAAKRGREPLRQFLERHADEDDRKMFYNLAQRMAVRNGNDPAEILPSEFRVVIQPVDRGVPDRLPPLHPLPRHRHGRVEHPPGDGHVHALAGDDLAPLQAAALRAG